MNNNDYDAVIIGGGFYGVVIAIYLAKNYKFNVCIIERDDSLLKRASYNNQARVHNGYHYPRDLTTAFRSSINSSKFLNDWSYAIKKDFTKLYAISRKSSKITSNQFIRFCKELKVKIQPAEFKFANLFNPYFIENVFLVEEYAFDSTKLLEIAQHDLDKYKIKVMLNTQAKEIKKATNNFINTHIINNTEKKEIIISKYVFNCTYSGINQIQGNFTGVNTKIKHEITEMALLEVPPILNNLGITVMDGPFFSLMPFPAKKLHTLSHVRYTPHASWTDKVGDNPYKILENYAYDTRIKRMLRDTARYLPAITESKYIDSLFEIKTVLEKNESNDGRPILFEKNNILTGVYSILGGKIDNIYDILELIKYELDTNAL